MMSRWLEAIQICRDINIDFADALILLDARRHQVLLHAFERKLSSSPAPP